MEINKSKLEIGDFILFHDSGFNPISWAIRRLTHSYWNHVAFYAEDGFLIEAQGAGVKKTPITDYNKPRFDHKIVRLKSSSFKDIKEYEWGIVTATKKMKAFLGYKYDWGAIIYLGALYLFKAVFGIRSPKDNPLQNRQEFFCSEVICEVCYEISSKFPALFQGKNKQDCDLTTPKDISKSNNVFFVDGWNAN